MRQRRKDRHLPPSVYSSHGAYYYVKAGKWVPLGKDLPVALAEYARITAQRTAGGMGELIDKVLAHVAPKNSKNTNNQYRQIGVKLKQIFAEFNPEQVRSKHIAAVKVKYAPTPFYANRLVSVLRLIFSFAVEWQIVESNPAVGILRHIESKRKRYLTDQEFQAIKDQAVPRLKAIMDIQYLTGQRIGDVLRIRHSDLLESGIAFEQSKTGARLIVRWNDDLRAAVARAKGLNGNVRAFTLFVNRKGKAPDYKSTQIQFRTAAEKAGIPDARPNDLRAKALTDAKRQGLDPTALAGHTDAKMTERYIRAREIPVVEGPKVIGA